MVEQLVVVRGGSKIPATSRVHCSWSVSHVNVGGHAGSGGSNLRLAVANSINCALYWVFATSGDHGGGGGGSLGQIAATVQAQSLLLGSAASPKARLPASMPPVLVCLGL